MKEQFILVVLAACGTLACAQAGTQTKPATPPPPAPQTQPPQAHPRRVQAKLDGFELAPAKASANQVGGASRGAGQKLALYAPHKARIYTLRPSFSWQGDPGAEYKLHIQDVTGTFAWNREVNGTSLAYPADAPPLLPGGTYLWRVDPVSPLLGPPPPAAMIIVIGASERAQLESAMSQISGDDFDADVARAKVFFDKRLWYDALTAYSDLIAKYPNRSNLYEMRGTLYDQLPETESLADADFARAH
ncbi:MAG: DUF928 domain-containing protein [Terracidiphilus sp.]|jgi:hypothetical protein